MFARSLAQNLIFGEKSLHVRELRQVAERREEAIVFVSAGSFRKISELCETAVYPSVVGRSSNFFLRNRDADETFHHFHIHTVFIQILEHSNSMS